MSDTINPSSGHKWSDERVELLVGNLLRFGVIIAAIVVIAGGIPYLIANGGLAFSFRTFHGQPAELTTVAGIIQGVFHGDSRSLIQLGLVLLIATPVARVALSLAAFAIQRDRMYVVITAIVLAILLWSLAGGKAL